MTREGMDVKARTSSAGALKTSFIVPVTERCSTAGRMKKALNGVSSERKNAERDDPSSVGFRHWGARGDDFACAEFACAEFRMCPSSLGSQ